MGGLAAGIKRLPGGFGQAKWRKGSHAAENFKRAREGVMAEATKKGVFTGSPIEPEVAQLLVDTLNLEVNPADIDPAKPLFREGLGLDSIDALEIALAISKRYGFQLRSDDRNNREIFASLRSLGNYIQQHRIR